MERKPTTAAGYLPESVELVRRTTLYIATKLGDLLEDVVVVGGLVPSLIIPQEGDQQGRPFHVGTMDVDLGLAIAVFDAKRYHEICERLRQAGFAPDVNESGQTTNQRWKVRAEGREVTIDFLIPPTLEDDKGGQLRNLEHEFAAIVTPGLELAFLDREKIALDGVTIRNERAKRDVWVCGAGAFVVLKSLALRHRGENKDAYDLVYVLRNYGNGLDDVFGRLQPLMGDPAANEALQYLEEDFARIDSIGPMRCAEFMGDANDDTVRADATAAARRLLEMCREVGGRGEGSR